MVSMSKCHLALPEIFVRVLLGANFEQDLAFATRLLNMVYRLYDFYHGINSLYVRVEFILSKKLKKRVHNLNPGLSVH